MRKESIEYRHDKHSVGLAHVHLVWVPKRRKNVLIGPVKARCAEIFASLAADNEWFIKAMEIAPDHVHLLVEHGSKVTINQTVKAFKGRSSRYLRKEFPHLLKLPSLWARSYFYDTTGKVTTERIEAYINDPHHD